jgi:putative acetyltransferase
MSRVTLRPATDGDIDILAAIYVDAVQSLAPQGYSPEAVAAWQRWPSDDPAEFRSRALAGHTLLAEVDGEPAAFAEFTPPDHLDFLYTRGCFARQGLASRLHAHLEALARDAGATLLRTEASLLSRPAFAKFGYEVFAIETVERYGQHFRRYRMRKFLGLGPPATTQAAPCRQGHQASFDTTPFTKAEETVKFLHHDPRNPGWFKGHDTHGTEGYFPGAWFEIDKSTGHAISLRDYDARELNVAAHDHVGIIEIECGWVRIMNTAGEIGWMPETCAPENPSQTS